jgi:signal peptidase II
MVALTSNPLHRRWIFWVTGLALLDQAAKLLILAQGSFRESIALWPGVFHLTLTQNTGMAFSALAQLSPPTMLLFHTALMLGLLVALWLTRIQWGEHRLTKLAMALIAGGALGNWLDRLRFGAVIDFIDVRGVHFPIFNLADVWLTFGALFLILSCLKPSVRDHV